MLENRRLASGDHNADARCRALPVAARLSERALLLVGQIDREEGEETEAVLQLRFGLLIRLHKSFADIREPHAREGLDVFAASPEDQTRCL